MTDKSVKISSIVENQLPEFIREEFPLAQEFLSQYYKSIDNLGAASDLIQNIDEYIKIDYILNFKEFTVLSSDISFFEDSISVESTIGFPETYGLIQIGSEIITYKNKTNNSFEGCVRGFSGVTSLKNNLEVDKLVFSESDSQEHILGTQVKNLSIIFLKEFLSKIKKQITPGFEDRKLYEDINEKLFIKQSGDFYKSKGTDSSFKILFYALYGASVDIIRPRDYLIEPSNAQYTMTKDIVAELVEGNPEELVNGTLYQDEDDFFPGARGTITNIEKIIRRNKDYYLISLDYDYNKDIDVTGSIRSEFKINPKTRITSDVFSGSNYIDVDSTIGFPSSGELVVDLENATQLIIKYESKTSNQFFGCSGITQNISSNFEVKFNNYVYEYSFKNRENKIKFRITGVISDLTTVDFPYLYSKDDTIQIKTLGSDLKDIRSNNWFFNIPTKYKVEKLELKDTSDLTYKISLFDDHSFIIGDDFTLTSSSGDKISGKVIFIENKKSIIIRSTTQLDQSLKYEIRKNISKVNIINNPQLNYYSSNVQNVYSDLNNSIYITSPSLPTYLDQPIEIDDGSIVFYGNISGLDLIFKNENGSLITHPFYTGDCVIYKSSGNSDPIVETGVYFIKKINENTVRLSRSRDNIFNDQYEYLNGVSFGDRIEYFDFNTKDLELKTIKPQGIIRKLSDPLNDGNEYETTPGPIGIFINGIELLNYKSKDSIFYGPIQEIIPLSGGSGYDVINPLNLIIDDPNGSECIAYCSVSGSLERIDVVESGFDYIGNPSVIITGGSGFGASAKVNLISYVHSEKFDARSGVGISENTITFLQYHKFRNCEEVIYNSDGNQLVSGISQGSSYYVSVLDEYTVKLHKSFEDSSVGINTINLTARGNGFQFFRSRVEKKKIGSISIVQSGQGYKNKKTSVSRSGINTASDIITIKNHQYETGELIKYYPTEIAIGGLSSNTSYYVTKLNNDQFKLSIVGSGLTDSDFYLNSNQYIDLTSYGTGNHYFNYEPISVKIEGKIGISSIGDEDFNAVVNPIFRGEIKSVFVENGGKNYGTVDILNYNRQPEFFINSGSGAQLTPIIFDGKIVDVIVQSSGNNYESIPDLIVKGSGYGCILVPILSNGSIIDVKVVYSGIGYIPDNTSIEVIPSGIGAKFESKIKSWTVNILEKKLKTNQIKIDDGFLYAAQDSQLGLEYTHLYSPRPLRSSVLSTKFDGEKTFYVKDLQLINGKEILSSENFAHSPIIGWAYDGNPIYGPYGFSSPIGGSIGLLSSSYKLKSNDKLTSENRPFNISEYPIGFFVEDYEYDASGDLDEYNGRFCVTPEFPNGVYAYFSTIDPISIENEGIFKNYRKPIFPYAIGNKYKSKPIDFNFRFDSNQNSFDLNATNWVRNTTPYNLLEKNSGYDYLIDLTELKNQTTDIKSVFSGIVDNINILNSGENYKVSDKVIFGNENTGLGLRAEVGSIKGSKVKRIFVEQIEIDDIELIPYNSFIGIKTEVSLLRDGDIVKISTPFEFNKDAVITLKPKVNLVLDSDVESVEFTGIITYFSVSGPLNSNLYENDLMKIDNEIIKILEIDNQNNRIKVKRNINNIPGITSYSSGTLLEERDNKFITNLGITTSYNLKRNREYYFESNRVVGLGTTYGVGITSTQFLDVENFRSQVSIGTGTNTVLYFNNLRDKERYTFNNFVQIADSTDPDFNVERSKVVGVGNTFIEIDFDTSELSVGSGVNAFASKWKVVRVPARTIRIPNHGLKPNDPIKYRPPEMGDPIKVIDPKDPEVVYPLPDDEILYPLPINDDLIVISPRPIVDDDDPLLIVDPGSNDLEGGETHSLELVIENKLKSKIIKNLVTIETETPHNLLPNDFVDISCISGISTTLKIKYNDYNRRTIIGEYEFSNLDVNINTNSITINSHNFKTGEKIIHQSLSPCDGLENEKIYYIFVIDQNTIRLTENKLEIQKTFPDFIQINSQSFGKLSKINPGIEITKFSKIIFDLSDDSLSFIKNTISYPAFEFNLYIDSEFKNKFLSTQSSNFFEVVKNGEVGVSPDAFLEINFNEHVPKTLYYKLVPINLNDNNLIKIESIVDNDQFLNNQIILIDSKYNGIHKVTDVDQNTNTFQYTLLSYPEKSEYNQTNAFIKYSTTAKNILGPVNSINLLSKGKNYKQLPSFIKIQSEFGRNCLLELESNSIGRLNTYQINNIGFDYSLDNSIRPKLKLPQIIKVEPLSVINNIDVLFVGQRYNDSPDLIVLDGVTNKIVTDLILNYDIKNQTVKIISNTQGINNVSPIIIPINNTNGFIINTITYNPSTKDVVISLSKEFSDPDDFPFSIGDKILIENTSVGESGKGYNSDNYNYTLFTIKDLDANLGGFGESGATLTYNLGEYLTDDENPGIYDTTFTSGIVIPESYFPIFNVNLGKKSFSKEEVVFSEGSSGVVESWDVDNQILKVSSSEDFVVGNIITGQSSETKAIIKSIISFEGFYNIDSSSIVKSGWKKETGFLNNELQRIHDNDYYQYFSYSIKSKISFDKWKDSVETLNHTSGFKKFSDLIIESFPIVSGINTQQNSGDFSGLYDLYSEINLNCVNDFDLVTENNIRLNNNLKSNEIYFENKIIQDYIESFGNRVLQIDDFSSQFNSNPRSTSFSIIDSFNIDDYRYKKYFIHVFDRRFTNQSELVIISLLHDNSNAYLNQYARIYTENNLGYFDFDFFGTRGDLLFYPNKFEINNYNINLLSFNIFDTSYEKDEINLGDIGKIEVQNKLILENESDSVNIISIGSSFKSVKALVQLSAIDNSYYEVNELNITHDGNNVYISEYGKITSGNASSTLTFEYCTYDSYIDSSNLIVRIIPNVSYASSISVNSMIFAISDSNSIGIGTVNIDKNYLKSNSISILSSPTPNENVISKYIKQQPSVYFIVSIEDTTNNKCKFSELLILYNQTNNQVYYTEFGVVGNDEYFGTISANVNGQYIEVYFTPKEDTDFEIRLIEVSLNENQNYVKSNFNNLVSFDYGFYVGTQNDIKKSFDLTCNQLPIFERIFNSEDSNTINIEENTIRIPNNYFVTGEEVDYVYDQESDLPIGINTTNIVGIGTTDKLPSKLYIIGVNDLDVRVAASASDALSTIPNPLEIISFGLGETHKFVSKKQNTKSLISIDNVIQSPVVSTSITTFLSEDITSLTGQIKVAGISSIFGGDLIKINDEIMRIISVGFGSTNVLVVDREVFGTVPSLHEANSLVTKVKGNYNISGNTIHFSRPPYGRVPILNPIGRSDELDYINLEIKSKFNGRVFLRSGIPNSDIEAYTYNYIFDDVSDQFTGYNSDFGLKSNQQNVAGISTSNSFVLVNNIFQLPSRTDGSVIIEGNYAINESEETTISFTGDPISNNYDVNTSSLPRGGLLVSIGSSKGFGYQPLVAAGGTAIVSISGTIQFISIGNSGSGYRVGMQTNIGVGVKTESDSVPNIEYIGFASVVNGHVVGISITNPGSGYTSTNPPTVIFDYPLSYSNIPLIYSNSLESGIGTGAVVDIVVGQGSSVISFELTNQGFGYKKGEILTVSIGGSTGIPTNTSLPFNEFQIIVDEIQSDDFSSWSFGDLQVIDPIDDLFNGRRRSFPLKFNGLSKTIRSKPGSNIDVQPTLLVFINDILQVPGESYTFKNGSIITFKEAPKGPVDGIPETKDTCKILFYRGTAEVDTVDVDILETVKVGDDLRIVSDDINFEQRSRSIEEIKSTDIVGTNLYSKEGISEDETLVRSVIWCKQTEDKFINDNLITKDRLIYEPLIYPNTNIIRDIDANSTEIFVENLKTFFDNLSEFNILNNKIVVISQESIVSASATAIVSTSGTISSIVINNGGIGYSTTPSIKISEPLLGIGSLSTASLTISNGEVNNIIVNNPGFGYTNTNPPMVLIEFPAPKYEVIDKVSYEGDFGTIIGVKTDSVGLASTALVFDFYIPENSFLRNLDVNNVGISTTGVSGIQTGYYFVVHNSNIGFGLTSLDSNGNVVGVGTTYIDGIYEAISVSFASTECPGVGFTDIVQVTVSVSDYNGLTGLGYSNFYGEYSWGRIYDISRSKSQSFKSFRNGFVGISTSPIVRRYEPLKYRDYI